MSRRRSILAGLATTGALALAASSALGATYTVSTNGDPNGGHCPASDTLGPCSLRAAVVQNDADGGGDTILVPPGLYLSATGLQPHHAITVRGTGAAGDTVLDANTGSEIFDIEITKGGADQGVTLEHLTLQGTHAGPAIVAKFARPLVLDDDVIADNDAPLDNGGGLDILAGTEARISQTRFSRDAARSGGAIATSGITTDVNSLEITDSEFDNNVATSSDGNGGGALLAGFGEVTIARSRFDDNVAPVGGALANADSANVTGLQPTIAISDSLFDHNQAVSAGGAISLTTSIVGSLVADNLTFLGDSAPAGTEISGSTHVALLRNSVLAGGLGRDCAGAAVLSRGHNVATDATCALQGAGDRQGVDPRLSASAVPAADSPLLDGADPLGCSPSAFNGVVRPQGAACDIGATERPAQAPVVTTGTAAGATVRAGVDPGGLSTAVTVDFGPTTAYGSTLQLPAVAGWLPVAVSGVLPASPGATLHYRIIATNTIGASSGADATLTTAPAVAGPGPGPSPDVLRPAIRTRISRLQVLRGHTRIRWRSSLRATVRFTIRRVHRGRWTAAASFRVSGRAGTNIVAIPRHIRIHLARGTYRLTATPVAPSGTSAHAAFRVARRATLR